MSTFVLYHANCFDGFGAKYAAWRMYGDKAEYIPVNYGQPLPKQVAEATSEDEVYILDFSYPRNILEELHKRVLVLKVLDHHKTAQEDLKGLLYATFDMEKSGAILAWEYFHSGKEIPYIIQDIGDGDLWKFERRFTEAVRAAMPLLDWDINKFHNLVTDYHEYQQFVNEGFSLLAAENIEVKHRVPNHVYKTTLFGHSCGCINCTTLISKTGSAIVGDKNLGVDVALMYQITGPDKVLLSFRAAKDDDVDVSVFAKKFGGGGHAKAAGGRCSFKALQNILDGEYKDGV